MKSFAIACTVAAAAMSFGSGTAFAQYDRNASNNPEIYQKTHPEDQRPRNLQDPREMANRGSRNANNYDGRQGRSNDGRYYNNDRSAERGFDGRQFNRGDRFHYGARSPEFRRGGYIPYEYRNRQYYVNDWRGHHLSAPPRGHQWVQVGSDYVLIALATGLIANLVLNQ